MIVVKNLTKSFGTQYALRGIHLEIQEGTFLSIFGPNGAGKTTFIRILSTLSRPSTGEILIDGKKLQDHAESFRQRIGVIGHSTFLYDELTAYENLQFYARLYSIPDAKARIHQALEEVGLKARADDFVRTFSRGMQQRLSIARAMLHQPDILLLDEPFTGLDQHASFMLMHWLKELKNEKRTILLVTHDLTHGLELAEHVAIFVRGKVAYFEHTDHFDESEFQNHYHKVVAAGGAA
ncbi:MAG: heme ABC exporter ATP-binding protein CcmA [candidate division KSB1 bacterium]|nr:heme ABC exporter ATP-binding protein CcmA [candidate division KSB1 bacterium]